MKIYVDTNIYLDFLLERKNLEERDLSEYSYNVFERTISCEFTIVVSDKILSELRKHLDPGKASALFKLIKGKIIKIIATDEDIEKAKNINTHFEDAIHVVLALKAEADLIVTRNKKDFKGLFKAKLPEEI